MGFFNKVWNVLTFHSLFNTKIIALPCIFIETYIGMILFLSVLNIKTNKKSKILYLLVQSVIGVICNFFMPNYLFIIINYLSAFLLIMIIFKQELFKAIVAIIFPIFLFGIATTLILNPYLTLFNITVNELYNIPIYNLGYLLFSYLIDLIIIFVLKAKSLKFNILENIDNKNKKIIITNSIFTIITLILQAFIVFYYIDSLPIITTFLSFIFFVSYFYISIFSLTKVMQLSVTKVELENTKDYNNTLRVLNDNVRGFKHDFNNIVTTIGGYIRTNDMDGLKNYYFELEKDCQMVNNLCLLNPKIINNAGIYNLLNSKYIEAESKNIRVNMTFLLDFNTLKMKIYEFARILGILLDNAIDASNESKEKIINIAFRNDNKNNRQLIVIENTYNNKNIDTEKIFEKGITEKENHTGLGLWEVRKILEKNHNANLFTSKNDKFFSQQLELY